MAKHLRLVPSEGAGKEEGPKQGAGGKAPALSHVQRLRVEAALPMVEKWAAGIAARYRTLVSADELLAPGTIGLQEAARSYVPTQHPEFTVYARQHVRGRMLEAIRAEHFSLRARIERAMDRGYDRFTSHQVLEIDLFAMSEEEMRDEVRKGSHDAIAASVLAGLLQEQEQSPEEVALAIEAQRAAVEALTQAIERLYLHERQVIRLMYHDRLTLDELAEKLDVSRATVQGRHRSALRKLRAFLLERGATLRRWPDVDRPVLSQVKAGKFGP
jgi:RNA polymerase sigma factor for flagellar operon FliA